MGKGTMGKGMGGVAWKAMLILAAFALVLQPAGAISIAASPGRLTFSNLLRDGYAEQRVTISTNSEEGFGVRYEVDSEIKDWVRFEPNASSFFVSSGSPYAVKVIVEPPADARNGSYGGTITFTTNPSGDLAGRAGGLVRAAIAMKFSAAITENQIVSCRAGGFQFKDTEVGRPLEFEAVVINDGNTRIRPPVTIDVWDQAQEELVISESFIPLEILPTVERRITGTLPSRLGTGQYWVSMSIEPCRANELMTFSVLEKGGIADRGVLKQIDNNPWALVNDTVEITATFENLGQNAVPARFRGTIKLEDRVMQVIDTEEVEVPAGQTVDFRAFFSPPVPGRYLISGRVIYNKKLSFEKGSVLNVNLQPQEVKQAKQVSGSLLLLAYLAILVTILFLVHRIRAERRKRRG